MILINNYYIDGNNNKWNAIYYSYNEAKKLSLSLIDCTNCTNCINCQDCKNCINCQDCTNCINCTDCAECIICANCTGCTDCANCTNCTNCATCIDCTNCIKCTNCKKCLNCAKCTNYSESPNRYERKDIGAGWENTCIYWDIECKNITVVCGCFSGAPREFIRKVKEKYSTKHKYIKKYLKMAYKIMREEEK